MRLALPAFLLLPTILAAQAPVADAFRKQEMDAAKNLVAAAEIMPADKYSYKPTPAQMSFADIMVHLAQGNDALCGVISGEKTPTRTKVDATARKDALVARLKETFDFCDKALASLDDSKLGTTQTTFGMSNTQAAWILITTGDWEDHYSQVSNYLRINGLLPPTAKPKK